MLERSEFEKMNVSSVVVCSTISRIAKIPGIHAWSIRSDVNDGWGRHMIEAKGPHGEVLRMVIPSQGLPYLEKEREVLRQEKVGRRGDVQVVEVLRRELVFRRKSPNTIRCQVEFVSALLGSIRSNQDALLEG